MPDTEKYEHPGFTPPEPAPNQDASLLGQDPSDHGKAASEQGEHSNQRNTRRAPYQGWKTPLLILGGYVLAFLLAVFHYVYFRLLDNEPVASPFGLSLRQSQISAISFLLVTAFRATIAGLLSICFIQCMWHVFRIKPLKVGLIEELFRLRSNPLSLANPGILRNAPLLFFVATALWIIPIATIYPPGALTIRNEPHVSLHYRNASILNPDKDEVFEAIDTACCIFPRGRLAEMEYKLSRPDIDFYYSGPKSELVWLTNQVKAFGNILPLDRSQGANSSYQISFQGPSVRCENTVTNLTVPGGENFTLVHSIGSDSTYNIFFNRPLGFYNNSEGKSVVVMECTSRLCKMHTSTYTANISYISGTQSIAYDATETTPLKFWPTLTPLEVEFSTWKGSVAEWFRAANSVAIWDSMVTSLFVLYNETIRSWNETTGRYENDGNYGFDIGEQIGWYKLPDGKEIELNRILTFGVPKSYPEGVRGDPSPRSEHAQRQGYGVYSFGNSVLNTKHFRFTPTRSGDPQASLLEITEPQFGINITESSLNNLLFNITISALTLNQWHDMVEVTDTTYINVYHFSHGLNFFLPYGLCLLVALIFVVAGLTALYQNGAPATDGFLQVFMTTRGNAAMSQTIRVEGGSAGGRDNAPKSLLKMKVRFGELIEGRGSGMESGDDASARMAGFGTMEETLPLMKGMGYVKKSL